MLQLSNIKKIKNLREIWPHEANDFSRWLAEEKSLVLLGETLSMNLELKERESSAGSFSVDIFAFDNNSNKDVIIENQLEATDHDHLGKIITYASLKGADIVIWIVKTAREEHKKAIDWLNEHTDENLGFYLLEIELLKIDDSLPAPNFNVIAKPNELAKEIKKSDSVTKAQEVQYDYWECFNQIAEKDSSFLKEFNLVSPKFQHWYYLSVGTSKCRIALYLNTLRKDASVSLEIPDDKELYSKLENHREDINKMFEEIITWCPLPKKKLSSFIIHFALDSLDPNLWEEAIKWQMKMCLIMKVIVDKYLVKYL